MCPIPEGITKIDITCFKNTDIEEIILPSSIKEIGWDAFRGCNKLTTIHLSEGIKYI